MKIGILSDTHGRHERAGLALALLQRLGAEAMVHCGDVGGEAVFDRLAGLPVRFVWGNTDLPDARIERYVTALGLMLPDGVPLRLPFAPRSVAVFHGHEQAFAEALSAAHDGRGDDVQRILGDARCVLYGHTHQAADTTYGGVRFINPGALHRAPQHTVATLDLTTDVLEFWRVEDQAVITPQRVTLR